MPISALLQEQRASAIVAAHLLGLSMFVTYILSKIRAYALYRKTVRELSQLSDRELDDLGISRFHIASVARQAAFA
jgi:uncharacterized protein YjiS (DUF1127 family)